MPRTDAVYTTEMADPRTQLVLVVGDDVTRRWDLAWALHEAGIPAEQASGDQARARVGEGRVAGVVVDAASNGLDPGALAAELGPDPETGAVPFVLALSPGATPDEVAARVQRVLQASCSSEPR